MKIIFLAVTGVHQALIAGYYYLGMTPELGFNNLEGFADHNMEISGFPIFLGQDMQGQMVYALGSETDVLLMKKTIEQLAEILGSVPDQLQIVPISVPCEKILLGLTNLADRIGAGKWYYYISRFILTKHLPSIFDQVRQIQQRFYW